MTICLWNCIRKQGTWVGRVTVVQRSCLPELKRIEDDRKAAIEQGSKHKSLSEIDTDGFYPQLTKMY